MLHYIMKTSGMAFDMEDKRDHRSSKDDDLRRIESSREVTRFQKERHNLENGAEKQREIEQRQESTTADVMKLVI